MNYGSKEAMDRNCKLNAKLTLWGYENGDVLPIQMIYVDETTVCLPKVSFPKDLFISPSIGSMKNKPRNIFNQ